MQGSYVASPRRQEGFTLIEVVFAAVLIVLLVGGTTSSFWSVSSAFDDEVADADLAFRARNAMDQIVRIATNSVTTDTAYGLLPAGSGNDQWGLRHRELLGVVAGVPQYENNLVVHLIGPNNTGAPSSGVVVGRGPSLGAIHNAGAGADGLLGTTDDDVNAEFAAGTPAVQLLVPSKFAPETGEMLTISNTTSGSGRLLEITLRTNFQRPDGSFLRSQDLVLTERVTLRF